MNQLPWINLFETSLQVLHAKLGKQTAGLRRVQNYALWAVYNIPSMLNKIQKINYSLQILYQ